MASLNRVLLAGNLTFDPEGRRTPSGTAVCNLRMAINRRYRTNSGEIAEEVTYLDVEVWGQQADRCRDFLRKGAGVLVEGRLKLDSWQDKNSGEKRSKLKVVAERVQFLTGRGDNSEGGAPNYSQGNANRQGGYQQGQGSQGYQQPNRPPPPPFPAGNSAQPPPATPEADDAFDVSDESIDDIPF